jgi:hypothetical protein
MLQLLKETVSSRHAERLETIVIWLIVVEIGMCLRLLNYPLWPDVFIQALVLLLFLSTCSLNLLGRYMDSIP